MELNICTEPSQTGYEIPSPKNRCDIMIAIPDSQSCILWVANNKICFRGHGHADVVQLDVNTTLDNTSAIFLGHVMYDNNLRKIIIHDIINTTDSYECRLHTITHMLAHNICANNTTDTIYIAAISSTKNPFKLSDVAYPVKYIQYRYMDANKPSTPYNLPIGRFCANSINRHSSIFVIKPDLVPDIYHVFKSNSRIGYAHIPDYTTSFMMNKLFRNVRETINIDLIEESDNEEDFENPNIFKYVNINKSIKMHCEYDIFFKRWKPIKQVSI